MYTTIRRYTVEGGRMDEMMRDIRDNFVPLISKVPGFVSYQVLDAGDRLVTISVFESRDGADESTRRAAEYVKQNPMFQRGLSKPEITAGEVKVHQVAERAGAASVR